MTPQTQLLQFSFFLGNIGDAQNLSCPRKAFFSCGIGSSYVLFVGGALAAYPYSATCVTVAAVMRFGCSMRGLHEALSLLTGMLPSWCCRCIAPSQPEDEFEPSRRAAALV